VRQVLLNLMSNAIKFTATGSVTLSARLEGNQVRIAVTDTGIGIPEKALASIFDRFEQARPNRIRNGAMAARAWGWTSANGWPSCTAAT